MHPSPTAVPMVGAGTAGHQRSRLHKAEQGALVGIATASFTLVIGEDLPAVGSREGCNFLISGFHNGDGLFGKSLVS